MSWWNPFAKKEETAELPPELADNPEAKGAMAAFYRKWKDPAFLKQLRTLAAHMQKDGVNVKDPKAVKAWLDKNKEAVEKGAFNDAPDAPAPGVPFVKTGPDAGRNDPCPCGSGKKFKKCCALKA